jgi:hypothetical protein
MSRYAAVSSPLLQLLKDNFTLSSVADYHEKVCSLKWKRFYTTNYDNSIELASIATNIRVESIDTTFLPKDFVHSNNLCIHINGYVKQAVVEDLSNKIKLSNSSYLSPDSFLNSTWRSVFKRDLETCSAIVFAGYSLYDFDVQKLLFELPHLKAKTYFITHEGASFKDTFEISQFGHVLPIGISGFAEIAEEVNSRSLGIELELEPEAFTQREIKTYEQIDDQSTDNLLLYGDYTIPMIDMAVSQDYVFPYIFKRSAVELVSGFVSKNENVLIHSDLGNGKSVFIDSLSSHLVSNGVKVYELKNEGGNYIQDLELFSSKSERYVLIIDNYHRYNDILEYISDTKPENITLIISDRNSESLRIANDLEKFDISLRAVNLDNLDNDEVEKLIEILDDQAYWKEFTSLSPERKAKKIEFEYNNQLSGVLLGLLNSPSISDRIKTLTTGIFDNPEFKRTLFSIAICDVLGVSKRSDIISDIAGDEVIYELSFRRQPAFKNFYKYSLDGSRIETKSSLLSLFLINQCFGDTYVKNECLTIVKVFNTDHGGSQEKIGIYKSLLRFHFIEKLLPQKKSIINNYYMELKRECSWLTEHPHYWVQYAMCKLTFDDYPTANRFLASAYSLAAKKHGGYHTENIDTQQARLNILMCLIESNATEAFKLFQEAHQLLSGLTNDGFKFRQVLPYEAVYEKKYHLFTMKQKVAFEHSCKFILEQISNLNKNASELQIIKRVEFISKAEGVLNDVIDDIKNNRGKKAKI